MTSKNSDLYHDVRGGRGSPHDWERVSEPDPHDGEPVTWSVCRRCGARMAEDGRTQVVPSPDCDRELVKGVMRS